MTLFKRRQNRRRVPLSERVAGRATASLKAGRKLLKVALILALTAALPVGIYFGYHALMQSDYFMVSQIHLEGNERLDRDTVLGLAGLQGRRNIFTLNAARARTALLRSPWIVDAEVETELPRTVRIAIRERQPAGWIYWNELYRVDTEGVVIEPGRPDQVDGPLITGLQPMVSSVDDETGQTGLLQADRVHEALAIATLYEDEGLNDFDRLAEIHFDELLGVSLLTSRYGAEIRLGNDRYAERMERLRDVYEALDGQSLLGRYILLDSEGDLTRVAVGPARPGRDGRTGGPGGPLDP